MRSQLRFTDRGRTFDKEEEIELVSAGVDIGSSTSHLVFSRLLLQRSKNRYVVSSRETIFESEIQLTPYAGDLTIDATRLQEFIARQYSAAGLRPEQIDTGVLIMTGVAARRENSRAIADIFAAQAGTFVSVSAGDALETRLIAHGSGAIRLSAERKGLRIMNVDLGGGTAKIAVCQNGEIVGITVLDVGARLLSFDAEGRIANMEPAALRHADRAGVRLAVGDRPADDAIDKLVDTLVESLFQGMGATPSADDYFFRLPPLRDAAPPDVLTFSGGVAEYLYGREQREHGDLGRLLADAVRRRLKEWTPQLMHGGQYIRATVVGASQHTVQVSGNTVFTTFVNSLPVRNVPVVTLDWPLHAEDLDADAIATAARRAVQLQSENADTMVAWSYKWDGPATYRRIDAFCRGVLQASSSHRARGLPLILVTDGDVGGLIGMHLHETCELETPVISIDGIELEKFDYIDIGQFLEGSGTVPVVIKSLVFPNH